jgi:hypothetical protein
MPIFYAANSGMVEDHTEVEEEVTFQAADSLLGHLPSLHLQLLRDTGGRLGDVADAVFVDRLGDWEGGHFAFPGPGHHHRHLLHKPPLSGISSSYPGLSNISGFCRSGDEWIGKESSLLP